VQVHGRVVETEDIIRRMKTVPAIIATAVVLVSTAGFVSGSAFAGAAPVRNGGYVEVPGHPSTVVEFVVGDHGTRVTEDGISCGPNSSLIAQGATAGAEQLVPIPQPLPGRISPGGTIIYNATVTLTPDDTQTSDVTVTTPVHLTIHFLSLPKVVINKTIAATGTVYVPNVCPGTTPLHFRLTWDPSARL
jgi:hypothetical protein